MSDAYYCSKVGRDAPVDNPTHVSRTESDTYIDTKTHAYIRPFFLASGGFSPEPAYSMPFENAFQSVCHCCLTRLPQPTKPIPFDRPLPSRNDNRICPKVPRPPREGKVRYHSPSRRRRRRRCCCCGGSTT